MEERDCDSLSVYVFDLAAVDCVCVCVCVLFVRISLFFMRIAWRDTHQTKHTHTKQSNDVIACDLLNFMTLRTAFLLFLL